jgi:hypothetical protein
VPATILAPMADQETDTPRASAEPGELPPGRTPPLDPDEAERLMRRGVALFNGVRYWHAHEAWETLWRAAEEEDRDLYQGLIQVAAGLLHLQRRNARGARSKLREGLERLERYQPMYRGILVSELVDKCRRVLADLDDGHLPYLIPPVLKFVPHQAEPDWSR